MKKMILALAACLASFKLTARDERGQAMVEYALLLVLIAAAALTALSLLGNSVNSAYSKAGTALAMGGGGSGSGGGGRGF